MCRCMAAVHFPVMEQRRSDGGKGLEENDPEVVQKQRKSGMGGAMLRLLAGTAEVCLFIQP